jgi:hypothetical protein
LWINKKACRILLAVRGVLLAWIGMTDLKAPAESDKSGLGPIAQALEKLEFDEACLLSDHDERTVAPYLKWLRTRTQTRIEVLRERLTGPTEFGEIHEAAVRAVKHVLGDGQVQTKLTFHLSPGTASITPTSITRTPCQTLFRRSSRNRRAMASTSFSPTHRSRAASTKAMFIRA